MNQKDDNQNNAVIIHADTIPELRSTIKKEPFIYRVRIQYKELRTSDSLEIPNLGTAPGVQILKDTVPLSCTIGFLDKKRQFLRLYRIHVKDERLLFKKVASYRVGTHRIP